MGKRVNQGYTILDSAFVGETEFVIGENPNAPSQYVTWHCKNGNDYYWGNYMNDYQSAKRDLNKRIMDEVNYLRSIGAMPPAPIPDDRNQVKVMEKFLNLDRYKPKKKQRHEPER